MYFEEMKMFIRRENEEDYRAVEDLVRDAFWNVYRPGCTEHYVLHRLRSHPDFVPELDFVMEKDGEIIGQNVFVRARISTDDGADLPIMAMGPICIARRYQRKGYGKVLLDYSLERAAELGCGAVCFEGNIAFYGKSGFTLASEFGVRYHGEFVPFFLGKELSPGYLTAGDYSPPSCYFVAEENPQEFDAFDALFPAREKKVLPGQLPL